jgi:hypothetical protein
MTPMRANIVGPQLLSATRIKTSTAVCQFGLRQLLDISGGILESDKLATAGQRDWIFEAPFPTAISRHAAA